MAETQTWDQLSRLKHVVQEGRGAESFAETIEEYLLLPTYIAFFSVGLSVSLSVSLSLCLSGYATVFQPVSQCSRCVS